MLYHYTSINALESILQQSPSENKRLCFWATRFDCFGDKNEYRLGIKTINNLLPRIEKILQEDRQISSLFNWDTISNDDTLPIPYVISFSKRQDNDYMWNKYADCNQGVVLALDDSKIVEIPNSSLLIKNVCLYKKGKHHLSKDIEDEYFNGANLLLNSPKKEFVRNLLKESPQSFVRLIAIYLLTHVASRIKESGYDIEEEIRIIIQSQQPNPDVISFLIQNKDLINVFGENTQNILDSITKEKQRKKGNGDIVFYRELFLPSNVLSTIYIKSDPKRHLKVRSILDSKGFQNVPIETL